MAAAEVIGIVGANKRVYSPGSKTPWQCSEGHSTILGQHRYEAGDQVVAGEVFCNNIDCTDNDALYPQTAIGQADGATEMILPQDSATRKESPITTGVLDYFPLAVAAVARLSKKGNDKHNPGQALHWSRSKSQDHADCIPRHLIDRGIIDPDSGESHTVSLAWRALAMLELEEEQRLGTGISRGSK